MTTSNSSLDSLQSKCRHVAVGMARRISFQEDLPVPLHNSERNHKAETMDYFGGQLKLFLKQSIAHNAITLPAPKPARCLLSLKTGPHGAN
jgi:hypothetical protein